MTVSAGNTILASDYNTLRGEVNRWFADNYAGSISFGNGNQTYGWGGSAAAVASGTVDASEYTALIDRCNLGHDIVNNVSGDIVDPVTGTTILASKHNEVESKSDLITSNRLDIEVAETSLSVRGSSQRTTVWGSAIDAVFRFTFTDFDEARYFWNSGGEMYIYGSISGYSTGTGWDGQGFNQIFSNMGSVFMDYTATTQTGSGGSGSATGYYNLTTSYALIFQQTGTGAYSNAYLQLYALRSSSGNYIQFRVLLTPEAGRSVNGTTTVYIGQRKLNNQTNGGVSLTITQPSYSLINGF